MADEYYEYSRRLEQRYVLAWDAPQPATDFSDEAVKLTLTETGKIEIVSPEDVWLVSQVSAQNGTTEVAVKQVVTPEEASQLAWANLSGRKSSLSVSLVDRAQKSDIVATQFWLQYRIARDSQTDRPGERFSPSAYETRYQGKVPAALVQQD